MTEYEPTAEDFAWYDQQQFDDRFQPVGTTRERLNDALQQLHMEAAQVRCRGCGAPSNAEPAESQTGTRCVREDGSLVKTPHLVRMRDARI